MLLKLSRADAAVLHPRLLAEFESTFGRSVRQAEATGLARMIRRHGRGEVELRLEAYDAALRQGVAKPVTLGKWIARHGIWEVSNVP